MFHLCLSLRQDYTSHKGIDSPTWIHHSTSKQGLDGWSIDAAMGEGDMAQVYKEKRSLLVFDTFKEHVTDEVSNSLSNFCILNVVITIGYK